MALYLIGLGLNDKKDISMKGFEIIKKSDKIYLENYTSKLNCSVEDLENFYGKKMILVDRKLIEEGSDELLREAESKDVSILIPGSPLAATTHFELFMEAKKKNIKCEIIDNSSILTATGITGLSLYKFGRTTTIPFDNKDIKSPYETYLNNQKADIHTLFLLDIKDNKMMTAREGIDYLIRSGLKKDTLVMGCAALGSSNPEIKIDKASDLKLTKFPQSFIIPAGLNFKEEEAIKFWKKYSN